jgi:DNA-directed RNA polymerase specialized sigma24 family protein
MMALNELAAFESAYGVLSKLDTSARRRALQWLTDALGDHRSPAMPVVAANGDSAEPEAAPAAAKAGGRRPSKPKAVARPARRKASAVVEEGRAYRRMPEPAEVLKAYRKAGTVSALAEHFDVPVYTVHSWARRLRSQGYQIGRER